MLAKGNYHVLLGSRSVDKGNAALKDLHSRNLPGSVEMISIDVTKDDTIETAARNVKNSHGKLDILVNNAAISPTEPPLRQAMRDAFDTNATGTAMVTAEFAPLLKKSTASSRIVNISSGIGSITLRADPKRALNGLQFLQYKASKAAMNMVTACQIVEYANDGIKVFAFCPGFTVSNLGPFNKPENGAKPTSEAVEPLVDIVEGKRDNEAGQYLHNSGNYPW